jgi:hypothetical protein
MARTALVDADLALGIRRNYLRAMLLISPPYRKHALDHDRAGEYVKTSFFEAALNQPAANPKFQVRLTTMACPDDRSTR